MVEDRFEGTTTADVHVGGRVAIPAGSVVRGVVTAVDPTTLRARLDLPVQMYAAR